MNEKCRNHPEVLAVSFCHHCGGHYCANCLVEGKEYYYCHSVDCQRALNTEIHEPASDLVSGKASLQVNQLQNEPAQRSHHSSNPIRSYATAIYVIAGLQIIVPLVLGSPENSFLGVVIAALGFAISRMQAWAAVTLIILGIINALVLALEAAIGSTVLSIALVACGFKAVQVIRGAREKVRATAAAGTNTLSSGGPDLPEQAPRVDTGLQHTTLFLIGLGVVAFVIAIGGTPQQAGLLGAAIIIVFWNFGNKAPNSRGYKPETATCPQCREELELDEDERKAGMIKCPECGKQFTLRTH